MNWMLIPGVLLYFLIGWWLAEACSEGNTDVKLLVLITWPIIIGFYILVLALFMFLALIHILIKLFTGFEEDE